MLSLFLSSSGGLLSFFFFLLQLVFFKMMNVTIIYIFKDYTSGDASDQCPLNQIGSQFMVLILTDIIVSRFPSSFISPAGNRRLLSFRAPVVLLLQVLKLVELFAPRIVAKLRYCVMKKKLDKQADDAKRVGCVSWVLVLVLSRRGDWLIMHPFCFSFTLLCFFFLCTA